VKAEEYKIDWVADFEKATKRFKKKKGFNSIPNQVKELVEKASKGELDGKLYTHSDVPTPHDVYKLRLPNPDTNAGESNGYRVYYMVVTEKKIIVFLVIYYKKEIPTVSDTYIKGLIDGFFAASDSDYEVYEE
jgi:mRNA-degrading endonuclease RelE of RelBE toxin-antitoxin system